MRIRRRFVALAAVIAALAAGGAGIAYAVGGDSEEQVNGPGADKARSAAVDAAGGGSATSVEREDGDGAGAYEVEVKREDGSTVEVVLDGQYRPVDTARDEDTGSGSDDDAGEGEE
jgi:Peptidase propeptide and YPEB domain